jgi:competence protein ComEC
VFSLVVVPLSLLLAFCAAIDVGAEVPALLAGVVARWSWQGLELAASHPFAALALPQTRFAELLLALLAVAMAVPRHALPGRRLALLGLLPLAVGQGNALDDGEYRLTVLDVGHGLAVVIETRTHRLLYDAGPLYQSGFDAGAEIVAPAVAALGTAPPDLMIVSHADSDHAGGAQAIRARYPNMFALGGPDVEGVADAVCEAGQAWTWDQVRFEILHPVAGFVPVGNESSCVLRVDGAFGSLLVTGDIERLAESRLQRSAHLAADVVVVPHHGSLTSSTPAFVNAVGARIALVSAGFNNRWGFPRPEVSARWQASGAQLLVTGDHGALAVTIDHNGIGLAAARDRRQRYWRPKRDTVSGAPPPSAL